MDVRDKIKKYLDDNGIKPQWFAKKIGMNAKQFYMVLAKKVSIPQKYWKAIVETSNYKISLNDLLEASLAEIEAKEKKES